MPARKPFAPDDLYAFKGVEDPQLSPDGSRLAFVQVEVDRASNHYIRHVWCLALDRPGAAPRPFTTGGRSEHSPRWSPDGRRLAFVSDRGDKPQIYLIDADGGEARPVTHMANGASRPVWSPDGRWLAFCSRVNADERATEEAGPPPAPANALEARQRSEQAAEAEKLRADPRVITRLPYRTGTDYLDDRRSHVYVVAAAEPAGPARRVTDGDLDFGDHSGVAWTADSAALILTLSRDPDHNPWDQHGIIRVPVARRGRRSHRFLTGPGFEFFEPAASPNGRWIAAARRPAEGSWGQISRLVLMPAGGGPARELTFELDRSVGGLRWSADSRWLYFMVNDRGDAHLYRARAGGGAIEPVITGRRLITGYSLDRAGQVAFTANTAASPGDVYVRAGGRERRVTRFNDDLLAERQVAPIETVWHRAPDGRRIQGWLLQPPGLRRGQKCPLVVSVHGGPWVMWGPAMPAMWFEWQVQAARGYAVYFCNPRGSEGYGEEHSLLIQNNWGDPVLHDILSGVDEVVSRGFVDPGRLALTGGSYGGYMTAWIVGHDARFACAWAQRGVYNLTSFFGTSDIPQLIEREFESFGFDNLEKLWGQSPLAYVRRIRTPLAIEHQDNDWRCPPSEAEQLFAALRRLKREVVLIRYPREGHEMSRSGEPGHRVDRLNRMLAWFDRHCRRPARRR